MELALGSYICLQLFLLLTCGEFTKENGKFGLLDQKAKLLVSPKYDYIEMLHEYDRMIFLQKGSFGLYAEWPYLLGAADDRVFSIEDGTYTDIEKEVPEVENV